MRGRAKRVKEAGVGDESDGKDQATALDETAQRYGLRRFVARNRGLEVAYRVGVAVIGFAIIVTGLALIPLPGPGWLIVFAGLAVLSTEFAWAERLLHYARSKVAGWTDWVIHQPLAVRALIGLVGLAFVAGGHELHRDLASNGGGCPTVHADLLHDPSGGCRWVGRSPFRHEGKPYVVTEMNESLRRVLRRSAK